MFHLKVGLWVGPKQQQFQEKACPSLKVSRKAEARHGSGKYLWAAKAPWLLGARAGRNRKGLGLRLGLRPAAESPGSRTKQKNGLLQSHEPPPQKKKAEGFGLGPLAAANECVVPPRDYQNQLWKMSDHWLLRRAREQQHKINVFEG